MGSRFERSLLLEQLARMGSHGRAEGEDRADFPRTFYPVPEHARAFDPDVVLIVGPRGAGKSELFRAATDLKLLPAVARFATGVRLPPLENGTRWLRGYPIQADFPDVRGLSRFFEQRGATAGVGLEVWFAYLVRVLWDELDQKAKRENARLFQQAAGDANANYEAFSAAGDAPLLALDRLDARLDQEGRYVFVAYDELDTLGAFNWGTMIQAVEGLVALWAGYTRRWRRIRAKVFLRTDLFQRHAVSGGADLAKLAANRVEITWSDRHLYAMLIKRIANKGSDLLTYCRGAGIRFAEDHDLGYLPKVQKVEDASPLVSRLVGQYMGANVKKGLAHRWLLDHIRDGHGHAFPRPLVRLIEQAAVLQRNSTRALPAPQVLDPTALRRALDHVSLEHVKASTDEWPWLRWLQDCVKGHQVPWEQRVLERLLDSKWSDLGKASDQGRPPTDSPRELVEYMLEVGIFRTRSDGRIDVPDLFLAGLGLKRKGGVRKA